MILFPWLTVSAVLHLIMFSLDRDENPGEEEKRSDTENNTMILKQVSRGFVFL